MAKQEAVVSLSFEADADLSAAQWKFVELSADGQAMLVNGAGQRILGVLQNDPSAAGRDAEVAVSGRVKVITGAGGLAPGNEVMSTAAGLAVVATTALHIVGLALTTAAAGELCEILLQPRGAAA